MTNYDIRKFYAYLANTDLNVLEDYNLYGSNAKYIEDFIYHLEMWKWETYSKRISKINKLIF